MGHDAYTHAMLTRTCLALSLVTSWALAQNPRPSVHVNSNPTDDAVYSSVGSDGDLVAVGWVEGGSTDQVFVAVSDGRALDFSSQVRVDTDSLTKFMQRDSVHCSGNNVYIVWEAGGALCFGRSTDGGATFGVPTVLPTGGGFTLRDWRVAVSKDPAGDHIYVAMSTAISNEDLFVVSSHDSGATFSGAVSVESVTTGDVDALAVACDGLDVHVVWDDNRSGRDTMYYKKSVDGGATFPGADVSLGDNVGVEDSQDPAHIAVEQSIVAVLWNEEPSGSGNEVIEVNVSFDGGATFNGATTIGNYTPGTHDTDFGHIAIHPQNLAIIATWEDNRTGTDQAYSATFFGSGAAFVETAISTNGAEDPWIVVSDAAHHDAIITWESTATFPRVVETRLSTTSGNGWEPSIVTVSDNPGTVDFVTASYSALYANFVHAWSTRPQSTLELNVGGFRPQSVNAIGWNDIHNPASTTLQWNIDGFGSDFFAFVLLSGGSGPTPLGSGRLIDLNADFSGFIGDPLFTVTLFGGVGSSLALPNPFAGTPPLGVTLYYGAVGFDGSVAGRITDSGSFVF